MSLRQSSAAAGDSLPPFDATRTTKMTVSPNPNWTYGDGLPSGEAETPLNKQWREDLKQGFKTFDLSQTPLQYALLIL